MSSKNVNPSYLYLEPKGEIITPFCMVFISRLVIIFNKICYISDVLLRGQALAVSNLMPLVESYFYTAMLSPTSRC